MGEPHTIGVQVRFADTDAQGHINNTSYSAYAEVGRLEMLRTMGEHVSNMILASLTIDFRRQVSFLDTVRVDSWVRKVGNSSFELAQGIYANDQLAADVSSVIVSFDYASQKSRALAPDMREALARYILPAGR
ncbi:MAG: thioesterase superfamily protein [Gemmatimonadetes bacterium]|nr:thioesterase superfamily protein [Gemmatimonadota bacterium]